jgi:hypothetical protein
MTAGTRWGDSPLRTGRVAVFAPRLDECERAPSFIELVIHRRSHGASKGIGLAVVKALVREGARVVAGSRTTTPELAAVRDAHNVTVVTVDLGTADGRTPSDV